MCNIDVPCEINWVELLDRLFNVCIFLKGFGFINVMTKSTVSQNLFYHAKSCYY